jgi:hypothetical protein
MRDVDEPVPDAEHGLQMPRGAWILLDLATDVLDVRIDGSLVRFDGDPVDGIEQLGAREHATRLARHMQQELELGCGQHDVAAIDQHLHPRGIEGYRLADTDDIVAGGRRLDAPHHGANPRHQLAGAERLGHVVVRAELEAGDTIGFTGPRGEHDDRHIAGPAQCARDIEPVRLRQCQVEHHEIGPAPGDLAERIGAVCGGHDVEPGALQVIPHEPQDLGLVVDDENALHGRVIVGAKRGGDEAPPRLRSDRLRRRRGRLGVGGTLSRASPAPRHGMRAEAALAPASRADAEHSRQRERAKKGDHDEAGVLGRYADRGCGADGNQAPGGASCTVHVESPCGVNGMSTTIGPRCEPGVNAARRSGARRRPSAPRTDYGSSYARPPLTRRSSDRRRRSRS